MKPGVLQVGRIRADLRPSRIGCNLKYHASTASTNDEVWARIDTPHADGLVVLAEHQSAGRGRRGRTWESPCGASLLMSFGLIDAAKEWSGSELALVVAVATHDAVTATTDVAPTIKWPNDLLVRGRKLGGILVESRLIDDGTPAYVAGIGINCLQHRGHFSGELAESATSLEVESQQSIDRTALAIALLSELDGWLATPRQTTADDVRTSWLERSSPLGARVQLEQGGKAYRGTIVDLDPSAALIVQLDEGGLRSFNAADTTMLPGTPEVKS